MLYSIIRESEKVLVLVVPSSCWNLVTKLLKNLWEGTLKRLFRVFWNIVKTVKHYMHLCTLPFVFLVALKAWILMLFLQIFDWFMVFINRLSYQAECGLWTQIKLQILVWRLFPVCDHQKWCQFLRCFHSSFSFRCSITGKKCYLTTILYGLMMVAFLWISPICITNNLL